MPNLRHGHVQNLRRQSHTTCGSTCGTSNPGNPSTSQAVFNVTYA
ncbi:MAG TPA: hypothetical protein VN794_23180 [Methylomirabilota bacterium]|nr:hypothetical protein [Methylomirabilota bacterium]